MGKKKIRRMGEQYKLWLMKHHCEMEISECGFLINPKFSQFGASADGLMQCCGRGCIKIKCPYKHRDSTVEDACSSCDKDFCLEALGCEL